MEALKSWVGVELSVVSQKEKIVSALGGFVAILILAIISERTLHAGAVPLVASMGASAVLLFAVPHGQLSQPWPVFAGHLLSALIGVTCARFIPSRELAAASAVCLSIWGMHQFKCIHPPGGATALTAVIGGPAVHAAGYQFVFAPVLYNVLAIIALAVAFNAFFPWRRYPAILNRPASASRVKADVGTSTSTNAEHDAALHADVIQALRSLDSFVDITEDDLLRLSEILR